ncbi:MAG: hypothetical protein R3B94_08325 [Hyphomonas sp.]
MTENVVKDIRFLQVIELRFRADKGPGGETPVGQVIEKDVVWHQLGHGDHTPARNLLQAVLRGAPCEECPEGDSSNSAIAFRAAVQARPFVTCFWLMNRRSHRSCSSAE